MSWARSFYLRKQSSLYRHRRIVSSCFCSEWSLWSFSSKMSKMSIMLIMLTVITSDLSDQSNHFKTLITQWLFNHCCYVITCERVLTSCLMFNNISFLFIQSLLNIASWCSISAINIDTVNFLWLSIMRLSRILWVIVFLASFSS